MTPEDKEGLNCATGTSIVIIVVPCVVAVVLLSYALYKILKADKGKEREK